MAPSICAAPPFAAGSDRRLSYSAIDATGAIDATRTQPLDEPHLEDRSYKENIALKEEIDQASMFEEIVGASEPLRRVLAHVERVARTDSTVLITGETGTGKELVARAIHKRSSRSDRAFIRVNCGAIPQSLIGSELFGHEKGAFTGATQRRLGRFELADGGTIFLDEVGELPLETQIAFVKNYLQEAVRPLFRADLELNLPSAIGVRVPHPKLKDAKFGDDGADADRHHLPHRDVQCRDRDFEQASVIKLTLSVGEYICPGVSPLRTEEEKNRNSAVPPVARPNSRPSISSSVPSCIPCGTTHNAFSGGL